MTPDDDLLARVHREAATRIRRRRAITSAAVLFLVVGIGAAAMAAASRDDDPDHVITTTPSPSTSQTQATTTSVPRTTTSIPPTTSAAPTTSAPVTTTSITEVVPAETSADTRSGDLSVRVVATVDRRHPGHVVLVIQVTDPRGSVPIGSVAWDEGAVGEPYGERPDWVGTECDPMVDEDPTTDTAPDPAPRAIDDRFELAHDYPTGTERATLTISAFTSFCTSDAEQAQLTMSIALR